MADSGEVLHPKQQQQQQTHIALLPSAGMGHITPFLRLATDLTHHRNYKITLITTQPIVSSAESKFITLFLSAFPLVNELQFHVLPFDTSTANSDDPFVLKFESIRRSAHLLSPLLASLSPPLSALISDVTLISSALPVTSSLNLPNYILFTSSARMFSLFAHFASIGDLSSVDDREFIDIPGLTTPLPRTSLPLFLQIPNTLLGRIYKEDSQKLTRLSGFLINTFEGLEEESLATLNSGKILHGLPPVFPVGPFLPCGFEKGDSDLPLMQWLDDQATGSVVFISFGSRTAVKRDQMREMGNGLVQCGWKFLWVVKDKKVDKEEEESLEEVMGSEFMDKMKKRGMVVKNWVDQGEILAHKAIGGFVSHCGWNSVVEAAWNGVRVLAWPQHGEQKINAEVVVKSGLGMWIEEWGWGEENVVKGEEIGDTIRVLMESEDLREGALRLREEALKVCGGGDGSRVGQVFEKELVKSSCGGI